ncbi:MAG: IS200/IS605 family transposase [Methylovulum sp.]|uniref:IS200/IS605 family transposase n=1 Tax=Methylovulum sp. TaxID=1916980 RepID=UPI00261DAB00|nr:IS200/IS605 family transposase [Methylovulum sp.]MDD2725598.1 IS200/IS605 family transposase [Methylovulum sp.]
MANTYTQLYVQLVFAVKGRNGFIQERFRENLQKYITGIVQNNGHKMLAIYCMPDHTHILLGLNPKQSIADLTRDIKAHSSKWINEQRFIDFKFQWQEGYGAFSYNRTLLDAVTKYILNQPIHHQKKTFKDEYIEFLEKFQIEYKTEYLFEWAD